MKTIKNKKTINKLKAKAFELWKDESGQGTAEYVLILVAVVGLAIVFGPKLKDAVGSKMDDVKGRIGNFQP